MVNLNSDEWGWAVLVIGVWTGNSCSGNERYSQRLIAIKKVELAAKDIAAESMNPYR